MNSTRYIGVVVKTRSDTKRQISQVVKTRFFPNYNEAITWLRSISDKELSLGWQSGFARYISPVDKNQYFIQP